VVTPWSLHVRCKNSRSPKVLIHLRNPPPFEPRVDFFEARCSIQLSYGRIFWKQYYVGVPAADSGRAIRAPAFAQRDDTLSVLAKASVLTQLNYGRLLQGAQFTCFDGGRHGQSVR
jgi:hypothetical protein